MTENTREIVLHAIPHPFATYHASPKGPPAMTPKYSITINTAIEATGAPGAPPSPGHYAQIFDHAYLPVSIADIIAPWIALEHAVGDCLDCSITTAAGLFDIKTTIRVVAV